MFVAAFDALFDKLDKSLLQRVAAVSASGQQHGSVYWATGASKTLARLNSTKCLKDQLGFMGSFRYICDFQGHHFQFCHSSNKKLSFFLS